LKNEFNELGIVTFALAIICEAGFGHQVDTEEDRSKHNQLTLASSMEIVATNLMPKFLLPSWIFNSRIPKMKRISNAFEVFERKTRDIITSRHNSTSSTADILSLLIKSSDTEDPNKRLTESEVFADTFAFLLAGHETSANTIAFVLLLLTTHPHEQQKVYEEVSQVLKDRTSADYQDYKQLIYTLCIVKEALRLYPTVSSFNKTSTEATTIGDYKIPAQTPISISIYSLHRNPLYWPNPEEFKPDRFDTRVNPPISPHIFIPFAAGPRNCIGQWFALMESVITVATIIKNYVLTIPPGMSSEELLAHSISFTLTPTNGVKIHMKQRL